MYVVVGVGIGNKILQVCLDSGQNRLGADHLTLEGRGG